MRRNNHRSQIERRSEPHAATDAGDAPLAFPLRPLRSARPNRPRAVPGHGPFPRLATTSEQVLAALDDVSRRMEVLARQLNCLGYFDDEDDRPKAA